eukprot:gnl/Dysnectes_brevis/14316_a33885_94.p2 GENE.gnl/Dysnectes_brevis/14316_a33885_94~~gnl/Dysnectes_brevis/14316_a33885_94.p2  ORF type:complete len:133 (+),score=28.48 gnl/Dysnectes_brevis/14316_a33885_94:616-1014(+)
MFTSIDIDDVIAERCPAGIDLESLPVCSICFDVPLNPVHNITCTHTMCRTCAEELTASTERSKCPYCREPILGLEEDGKAADEASRLVLRCANHAHCPWTGEAADYSAHELATPFLVDHLGLRKDKDMQSQY